jgi:hypothetical protein
MHCAETLTDLSTYKHTRTPGRGATRGCTTVQASRRIALTAYGQAQAPIAIIARYQAQRRTSTSADRAAEETIRCEVLL